MGETENKMDEVLFMWIMDLENMAQAASDKFVVDKLLDLRRQMIEQLYAVGGEWADRYRGMQGG